MMRRDVVTLDLWASRRAIASMSRKSAASTVSSFDSLSRYIAKRA